MATTTNYGWDTPDDTDLVKDGALAMRDLGQDVDTSLFSITNGKNVGLSHIVTTTFSASTAVSFNNCFSSGFDYYKIYCEMTASASSSLRYRYRASGTDITFSGYQRQQIFGNNTTLNGARVDNFTFGVFGNTGNGLNAFDITTYKPFVNSTKATISTVVTDAVATATRGGLELTGFSAAASYDGITIFPEIGNITGTIRIYGLRNS